MIALTFRGTLSNQFSPKKPNAHVLSMMYDLIVCVIKCHHIMCRLGKVTKSKDSLEHQPGLYACGWVKRGPTGIIGAESALCHAYDFLHVSMLFILSFSHRHECK